MLVIARKIPVGNATASRDISQGTPQTSRRTSPVQKAADAFMRFLRKSPTSSPPPPDLRDVESLSSAGDSLDSVCGGGSEVVATLRLPDCRDLATPATILEADQSPELPQIPDVEITVGMTAAQAANEIMAAIDLAYGREPTSLEHRTVDPITPTPRRPEVRHRNPVDSMMQLRASPEELDALAEELRQEEA